MTARRTPALPQVRVMARRQLALPVVPEQLTLVLAPAQAEQCR
jgi:hypothetical protein